MSEELNQKHYTDLGSYTWPVWNFYRHNFLRCHFAQKLVVVSWHLGCFLRLENHIGYYNDFKTKNKNYLIIMIYLWSGTNSHCFTVKEVSWWASLIDVRTHVLKGTRQLFYRKSLEILETKLEPFLSPMKKTGLGNKRNSESSLILVLSEDRFCPQHKHLPEIPSLFQALR